MLYEYLVDNYKQGEPIFLSDIIIDGISEDNMRQKFKQLTDRGLVRRYDKGIYYIPKKSRLNGDIGLSAETVARYKYIERRGRILGYYTGYTLANQLGLSMQVPIKEEIVSNNMAAITREVKIGNRSFIVRKSKIEINESNFMILQLLDLLKELDMYTDNEENAKEQLQAYIRNNNIKRAEVDKYIEYFPLKTYKNIYKMRLDNVFA